MSSYRSLDSVNTPPVLISKTRTCLSSAVTATTWRPDGEMTRMGTDCHVVVGLFSAPLVGESFLLFSGGPSLRSAESPFVSDSLTSDLVSGHVEILWPSVAEKVYMFGPADATIIPPTYRMQVNGYCVVGSIGLARSNAVEFGESNVANSILWSMSGLTLSDQRGLLRREIEALFHDFISWRGKLMPPDIIGCFPQSGSVSRKHDNFCQNPRPHTFLSRSNFIRPKRHHQITTIFICP